MSYCKLKNICNNVSSAALTSNQKYTDPFSNNHIVLHDDNNFNINSFEYLNNNLYHF